MTEIHLMLPAESSPSLQRFLRKDIPIHPSVITLLVENRETGAVSAPQGSEEWLAQRAKRLTASDFAAALGLNTYKDAESLAREKAGYGIKFTGNAATRHGQQFEPVAAARYEEESGEKVIEFGLIVDKDDARLGGSPDGITLSGRLLEIKVRHYL